MSICTLVMDGLEFTKKFIQSIEINKHFPYELIIIDNGSRDETSTYLKAQTKNYFKFSENQGFCKGFNKAVELCNNEYILLTNNDTIWPNENWGMELIQEFTKLKNCGLIFPCANNILTPANRRQARGIKIIKMPRWRFPLCAGVAIFTTKKIFQKVGGFSEKEFWVSGEDYDLQCKIWEAGYDIYITEKIFVEHIGKATTRNLPNRERIWEQSGQRFHEKWKHKF